MSDFLAYLNQDVEKDVADDDLHKAQDVLTSIIGETGRFQLINMILLGSPLILIAMSAFVTKFLTQEVAFWCQKVTGYDIVAQTSVET